MFKSKTKIAGKAGNNGTKNIKAMVPLKYLSNFWRILEITLLNCEINLILTWFGHCFVIDDFVHNQVTKLTLTDTKIYVPIVTLSTGDNEKLLRQLISGFQRTINWNK